MATTVKANSRTDGSSAEPVSSTSSGERPGAGWIVFAGIVLMIGGTMRFFDAAWAFSYHGTLPANLEAALFGHSLNTYGWVYVVVGMILVLSGIAVMAESQVARWIGVVAGAIGAVSAIWWMPYYPVWSLTYVGLGVLVVYALVAHGQRSSGSLRT